MNDGAQFLNTQIVATDGETSGFEALSGLAPSSALECVGDVVEGGKGGCEIRAREIKVLQNAEGYPLANKFHSLEYLRSVGHIRNRTQVHLAINRVANRIGYSAHQFFQDKGFIHVRTPIITTMDCEGAGDLFSVSTLLNGEKAGKVDVDYKEDFFGVPTYLTVSGQLNAEVLSHGSGSVYTFGPTFRAENSNTTRHIAEFWMIEPEIAFSDLEDNMNLAEEFIKHLINATLDECKDEMAYLSDYEIKHTVPGLKKQLKTLSKQEKAAHNNNIHHRQTELLERLQKITNSSFVRLSYTEAIEILQASKHKFSIEPKWGIDLNSEHERYLTERHFEGPVILYNYPKDFKPFYMRQNEDGKTVGAMDVLLPGVGEIIGGGQREERESNLLQRMKEMNLPEEEYEWYTDLRRFGSVKHSGFGAGFERLVCFISGMDNIRDVIPFPRYPKHAKM